MPADCGDTITDNINIIACCWSWLAGWAHTLALIPVNICSVGSLLLVIVSAPVSHHHQLVCCLSEMIELSIVAQQQSASHTRTTRVRGRHSDVLKILIGFSLLSVVELKHMERPQIFFHLNTTYLKVIFSRQHLKACL